jgi:hypothetical protein
MLNTIQNGMETEGRLIYIYHEQNECLSAAEKQS